MCPLTFLVPQLFHFFLTLPPDSPCQLHYVSKPGFLDFDFFSTHCCWEPFCWTSHTTSFFPSNAPLLTPLEVWTAPTKTCVWKDFCLKLVGLSWTSQIRSRYFPRFRAPGLIPLFPFFTVLEFSLTFFTFWPGHLAYVIDFFSGTPLIPAGYFLLPPFSDDPLSPEWSFPKRRTRDPLDWVTIGPTPLAFHCSMQRLRPALSLWLIPHVLVGCAVFQTTSAGSPDWRDTEC